MLLPGGAVPLEPRFDWFDKAVHLLVFLMMAVLASRSFTLSKRFSKPALTAGGVVLAYSVLLEALQALIPGRFWDPADLLAGATGVLLGLLLQSVMVRG